MRFSPLLLAVASLVLVACSEQAEQKAPEVIRGLKSVKIEETASSNVRLFPSILSPSHLTNLSFKVAGQLQDISNIRIGQRVSKGDVLARLDPTELTLAEQSAKASLDQARANAKAASDDLARKQKLAKKGVIAKAALVQVQSRNDIAKAQIDQAEKQLEIAADNLAKAELKAPFSGVIAKVSAQSFTNISPGSPIASLYQDNDFEVAFSVPFEVSSEIAVGKKVTIRLSDLPEKIFEGYVKELGASADKIAEFPIVIAFSNSQSGLKSGMPVEVAIDLPVYGADKGYVVPLSVLAFDTPQPQSQNGKPAEYENTEIFVYDPTSQTVKRRTVEIGGIRKNALLITKGVKPGEHVASAGVSFLRDGMKVKLLSSEQ